MGSEHQHLVSGQKSDRRRSTLAATLSRALRFSAVCTGLESARAGRLSNRAEICRETSRTCCHKDGKDGKDWAELSLGGTTSLSGPARHLAEQKASSKARTLAHRHQTGDRTHRPNPPKKPPQPLPAGRRQPQRSPKPRSRDLPPPSGRRQRNELGSPRAGSRSGALRGPLG
ncbi:hypothetical protein ACCO45_005169 [Purpureocillium lilacinum]|uniref:Uncharacterized protein n=1 Tax=Purpureocillium lilacinum TaxID=33203 RepID=A0ACC4DUM2_PURLI